MAGVGLALRRAAAADGIAGPLGAFGYALVLACGPYLATSAAVLWLGGTAPAPEAREGLALVAYATAASLVAFAPLQFAFARVLGDLLYEGRAGDFAPAFIRTLGWLLAPLALAAAAFLAAVPVDGTTRLAAFALCLALAGTWLAMVPLSAAKGYRAIALVFTVGLGLGAALAHALDTRFGLAGLLAGLAVGQGGIFAALLALVDREFGAPHEPLPDLGRRLARHGALVAAGLAYGLGLWIDRLIFWLHPDAPGVVLAGPLRVCPLYDNGMSLAALTTVPAFALFLLLAETDLARGVRGYFTTLEARASLETVERARRRLATTVWSNLRLLALVQGVITLGVVVFAPEIIGALKLPWLSFFVFRTGALGSYFQVLFMAVMVHLLYLDLARQAAVLAGLFVAANAALTWLAMAGGLPAYGYGFACAAAIALVAALWVLDGALADLERHVFARQPL